MTMPRFRIALLMIAVAVVAFVIRRFIRNQETSTLLLKLFSLVAFILVLALLARMATSIR